MVVITLGVLISRRVAPVSAENHVLRLVRKEVRVLLLIFGGLLFWPREAFLTTLSVEIALVAAVLLVVLLRYSLQPIFDLIGVQLSWPSDPPDRKEP